MHDILAYALRKDIAMKRMVWIRIFALLAAFLLIAPMGLSLADGWQSGTPEAALIGSDGGGQLTLQFYGTANAVAGKTLALKMGDAVYIATLEDGDVADANGSLAMPIGRFTNEMGQTPSLTMVAGCTVDIDSGAFTDGGGQPSPEMPGLVVTAAQLGSAVVTHSLQSDMGWMLTADGTTTLEPGAQVPLQTVIRAVPVENMVNPCTFLVYSNAQLVQGADLKAGYTVVGDTEIVVQPEALNNGTGSYSPNQPRYGDSLTAAYTPAGGSQTPSKLEYAWYRLADASGAEKTLVHSGKDASGKTYQVSAEDIGYVIQVEISSPWSTGSVTGIGSAVAKADAAPPTAPTVAAQTDTSVQLNAVDGCQYRMDDGQWQDSSEFTGLTPGKSYAFYQRYAETSVSNASPASAPLNIGTTTPELTGTVTISGVAKVQSILEAVVENANNTGELRYAWKRGGQTVGNGKTYTVQAGDVGQSITLEVTSLNQSGMLTATSQIVGKSDATVPAAPTLAGSTANSITLNAVAGCEYSMDGVNWQDGTTFSNLNPAQSYTFYQRYKETGTAQASQTSGGATFSTSSATLTGTIQVAGDVRYGKTLVATFNGSGYAGTLQYIWYRGSTQVGTGQTYDVSVSDIGNPVYVRVVASSNGSVTQLVGVAQKAEYTGITPAAPTRASRSTSRITLTEVSGYEYSRGGSSWQSSPAFTGLKAGTSYKFYQRVKATDTMDASPASPALTTSTSESSSTSSGSSSSSDNESSGSSGSGSTTSTLTSYTLSGANTRILFSTMESLLNGNKTQDVTIHGNGVEYTFAQNTMALTTGKLWYDFGAEINNCAHLDAAKEAAGEHFVALVHFNMDGNLPAKATIRLSVGAQQAGKTLYYYKFTPTTGVLSFMQTSTVDASGYATVEQSSCSDYVFLDADINAAAALTPGPTLSPTPEASASPTPLIDEATDDNKGGSGSWLMILIILVALLLIVIGVCMFIKSRNSRSSLFDEDDDSYFDVDDEFDQEYENDDGHYAGLQDGYSDDDEDGYADYRDYEGYDKDTRFSQDGDDSVSHLFDEVMDEKKNTPQYPRNRSRKDRY